MQKMPSDGELACKNAERALAAEIVAQIYKWQLEGKTDSQIVADLIELLNKQS